MSKNIKWYVLRLKAMSLEEILHRVRSLLIKKYVKYRSNWIAPTPKLSSRRKDWWEFPTLQLNNTEEYESLIKEAQSYLAGEYRWLNLPSQESPLNWHADPQSNHSSPLKFGLEIDYRDVNLLGNVKNIWEKNRHHHLTIMAAAFAITGDEKYAAAVEEQLKDWVNKNPFPIGVNWTSSLELGTRLISWVWIDRFLRNSNAYNRLFGESGILWSSIYWHQWLISKYYSHGSSANNHLIGEMAGLFISSCQWSVFSSSQGWQALAWEILEREIPKQTFASGLNREQAFEYQIFTAEFFLLAGIEADMNKISVSQEYKSLVCKMLEVIPLLTDVGGNLPRYGDGDEGMALQIRPHNSSRTDWLYRLARQWLGAKIPLQNQESGYLASALVNLPGDDDVGEISLSDKSIAYDDAGIYVLAHNRGSAQEILCLADAGNLGFLSIAAHGHADALAFTLSIGGVPIIVDPGTYVYHADDYWRSYFRSTKAHNTIVVDNHDQSEPQGTFLWTRKAQTKVLDWQTTENKAVLEAEHDGYSRLEKGIVHRRRLALDSNGLEITDHLCGDGVHNIEWRLHFYPQCKVSLRDNSCLVQWDSGLLVIHLDEQLDWTLLNGDLNGGWYSSGFNLKEPIVTLLGSSEISADTTLENFIDLKQNFASETGKADQNYITI